MKKYLSNNKYSPIMISVPHAGTFYPKEFIKNKVIKLDELRDMEDFKCHKIIEKLDKNLVDIIVADCSRSVIDLNRSRDSIDDDMFIDKFLHKKSSETLMINSGLGVIPKKFNNKFIFSEKLPKVYADNLLKKYYDPYHNTLFNNLKAIKNKFGFAILIDLHSMPSDVLNNKEKQTDIIIGDNFGKSCSKNIRNFVFNHFEKNNYLVKLNAPYAGGYITRTYGKKLLGLHAIQIEINKNLYLDEKSLKIKKNLESLQNIFSDLIYKFIEIKNVAAE
tara:strand:+ start:1710 stop:2537 length:828 start_codon:yes stop_codon:yes gene_type:complete